MLNSYTPDGGRARTPALITLLDRVAGMGDRGAAVACVAMAAALGVVDYITGTDVSFAFFYLVPVFLAAGAIGRFGGLIVSALAAVVWLAADAAAREGVYATALLPAWNMSVRGLIFSLVAVLVSSLRELAAHERALSRTDMLSGLANTRGFFEFADAELVRSRRSGRPLTVAYLDIDDFKSVNDTRGHLEGDCVISETGVVIARELRGTDSAGRVGGDEFALFLPDTDRAGAEVVIGRLHLALQAMARSHDWPIGFSIGAVSYAAPPAALDAVVTQVDGLMYEVKRAGKRAVRFETDRGVATATMTP